PHAGPALPVRRLVPCRRSPPGSGYVPRLLRRPPPERHGHVRRPACCALLVWGGCRSWPESCSAGPVSEPGTIRCRPEPHDFGLHPKAGPVGAAANRARCPLPVAYGRVARRRADPAWRRPRIVLETRRRCGRGLGRASVASSAGPFVGERTTRQLL